MEHPYLGALHCPEDEPITEPVSAFDFDFEIYDLKCEDYKELLYEEVMLYQSDDNVRKYLENKERYPNGILGKIFGNLKLKQKK